MEIFEIIECLKNPLLLDKSWLQFTLSGYISVGNVLLDKRALTTIPKWFLGNYERAIFMAVAKDYTSVLSIQLRRLGCWMFYEMMKFSHAKFVF